MKLIASTVLLLALATPPSGRPPLGPLARYDPRVYDFKYEVSLSTELPLYPGQTKGRPGKPLAPGGIPITGESFDLSDTPIVFPLIFQGTYSRINQDTIKGELWLGDRLDTTLPRRARIDDGLPFHTHLAVLPIVRFTGKVIRFNVSYRVQVFSSRLNDAQAARIAWPREWPAEVADGLKPQRFIESDDPIFAQTVQRITQGRLRMVAPYVAAKELVRYCINEVQVTGDGLHRGNLGVLRGMDVTGAKRAATAGRGSPHDLVCVCVAMLRAAGIPARPVIGVEEDSDGMMELLSWAEFYLPDAGWVPFDPAVMRGKAVRNRDIRQPWPEFGTMKDLNDRIPLAYHFVPPRAVHSPQYPAAWGWDPRPRRPLTTEQIIKIFTISRGKGVEDPR